MPMTMNNWIKIAIFIVAELLINRIVNLVFRLM